MEIINLYPEPEYIDIGERQDNDPPVFEKINLYKLTNAYISSFGYIIANFKLLKEGISYRHRNSVTLKNIFSFLILKKKLKINTSCLSIANGWSDGYYHFTLECLPKLFLLKDHINSSVLVFPGKLKPFHKQWFDLLNIKKIQLLNEDEIIKTPLAITTNFTSRDLNHHHIIIPEFKNWVLSNINNKNSIGYQKIFIGRKRPNSRIILNNDEVKEALAKFGFVYFEMEDYLVEDQIKIFSNADQIISAHGAALSNICFCKPRTKIIDLMHEDYKQWCFLKLAIILNLDYTIYNCQGDRSPGQLPDYVDIKVDVKKLTQLVEKW